MFEWFIRTLTGTPDSKTCLHAEAFFYEDAGDGYHAVQCPSCKAHWLMHENDAA